MEKGQKLQNLLNVSTFEAAVTEDGSKLEFLSMFSQTKPKPVWRDTTHLLDQSCKQK